MAEAGRLVPGIDTSVPNITRMYDYWLGSRGRTDDSIIGFTFPLSSSRMTF